MGWETLNPNESNDMTRDIIDTISKAEQRFNAARTRWKGEKWFKEKTSNEVNLFELRTISCVDSRGYFRHATLRIPLPLAKKWFTHKKPRISVSFTKERLSHGQAK